MRLTFLFLCILTLVVPQVLLANTKVTPLVIDREVKPRDIFTETITITNNENYTVRIYPSVNAVAVDEGGDVTEFTPPSMSDNKVTMTSWLEIKRSAVTIEAGKTKEIPLNIKVHPEAEPGVYHAVIGFGSGRNRDEALKKVTDGLAPRIVVTLNVDQERNEFLKLDKFIVERFVTKASNNAISYTLTNPGEANVVPTGEIILSNSRGEEVGSVVVNPDGDTLAPGQETTYTVPAPTEGLVGKYKAFLTVDYGTEQLASVYDTAFFYVLPWQKLLGILAVLLLLAVVLTLVLHRRYQNIGYSDGSEDIELYIRDEVSEDREHDVNLKKNL